ncbi:30S ribosome-binding factor RbfA [Halothiobacillus sp. DCM-1]|uniref:30S ribosome-binding factor RbfA n=1 Tax=Halothiobacillus sp. DCM-1 TaxID=3112558 RepID=UPI0032455953
MAQGYGRHQRVAEQIQREIAELLRDGVRQAGLSLLTVTDCEVTRDLSYAKVFYSVLSAADRERAQAWLDASAGGLRTELAHRLRLRSVPKLSFHFDESIERGMQMDALIAAVRRHESGGEVDGATEGDGGGE